MGVALIILCLAGEKVMFDFESAEELGKFETRGVRAELSPEHATRGKNCARLTYEPGEGFRVFMWDDERRAFDLGGCTHFMLDLYCPEPVGLTVKLKSNAGAKTWYEGVRLKAGKQTLTFSFDEIGIDPRSVHYLNLFIGSPAKEAVVFVDNVRAETKEVVKAAPEARTDVMFDFESEAELKKFDLRGVRAEMSDEHVTSGKRSVKLTYLPGGGLGVFMWNDNRRPFDLSKGQDLMFDVYSEVVLGFAVKLKSDRGARKWTRNVTVEPGGETVVLPFADMDIDPKSVSYFHIFMGAPADETVIFLDNVRAGSARVAEKALPKKLERPDDELF